MSRTSKRGKAKLGRTSIEVTQDETYTFQELFNIYMFAKEAEGLAKRTLENKKGYFSVFHRYLEEHHADVTPNTLDTNTIREFLHYLKNDHIKHKNNHCVKDDNRVEIFKKTEKRYFSSHLEKKDTAFFGKDSPLP